MFLRAPRYFFMKTEFMTQPVDNKKEENRGASEVLPRDFAPRQPDSRGMIEAVADRIKQVRNSLALTQKETAIKAGMPLPSYKDYETGKKIPGGSAIQGLMRLGINANWLLTGEGPMRLADITQEGISTAERYYVPIPKFFGVDKDGQEFEVSSEIASLALDRQWLGSLRLRPGDLTSYRMPDGSMVPTIREGNLVVVDSSTDKLRGDGIYALMYEGNISVKRLQMDLVGGVLVCGDNPTYKEQRLPKEEADRLTVLGMVIWSGGIVNP